MLAFFVNRMYTLSQQPPDRAGCPAFYSMEMNEMKTMKKLTALLLALTMALALTACSSAGDPTQPPETKPVETQPAAHRHPHRGARQRARGLHHRGGRQVTYVHQRRVPSL